MKDVVLSLGLAVQNVIMTRNITMTDHRATHVTVKSKNQHCCKHMYLTAKETYIIQYPFNTRNRNQPLP